MEVWKTVAINDAYEVSSIGRVRRAKPGASTRVGRVLIPTPHRLGYHRIRLHPIPQQRYIHQLVWETFVGPIPKGLVINHKNGIKNDNRVENLEVCTQAENVWHAWGNGMVTGKRGETNPSAKLNEALVRQIRAMQGQGMGATAISKQIGFGRDAIQDVVSRRTWKHVV